MAAIGTHAVLASKHQCANCKRVHYCCKKHQTADWKVHKQLCSKLPDVVDPFMDPFELIDWC